MPSQGGREQNRLSLPLSRNTATFWGKCISAASPLFSSFHSCLHLRNPPSLFPKPFTLFPFDLEIKLKPHLHQEIYSYSSLPTLFILKFHTFIFTSWSVCQCPFAIFCILVIILSSLVCFCKPDNTLSAHSLLSFTSKITTKDWPILAT